MNRRESGSLSSAKRRNSPSQPSISQHAVNARFRFFRPSGGKDTESSASVTAPLSVRSCRDGTGIPFSPFSESMFQNWNSWQDNIPSSSSFLKIPGPGRDKRPLSASVHEDSASPCPLLRRQVHEPGKKTSAGQAAPSVPEEGEGRRKEKKKGRKEKNAFPVPFGTFGRGGVIIQMGRLERKGKIRIPDSRKY